MNAIVTCAPRWKSEKQCQNVTIPSRPNGICYLTTNSKFPTSDVSRFYSFVKCESQIYGNNYHYVFAEAGMSIDIVKELSELIIGAPGFMHWRGGVFRYRFSKKSSLSIDIPCPTCNRMHKDSYFGYSVTYGRFTISEEISYVSSAPRAAENRGKVLVFKFEKELHYWRYIIIKEREGTQLGEYFGASLCAVDLNKDGLDDLLIGAPLHTIKQNAGDEGVVYILLSSGNYGGGYGWKDMGEKGIITGSEYTGARFGSAISSLGDINMDGYPDIAVGAPYENDKQGAIYIYLGNRNGLNSYYSQRIIPSEKLFLKGFGASISKGLDVDGNSINDIVVGSYLSGHAVLIKSYPVVTISPKFYPKLAKIPFATKEFEVNICISYSEKYPDLNVDVANILKLDSHMKRASFWRHNYSHIYLYNVTLISEKIHCNSFSIFIQNKTDFSRPIDFVLEYKLLKPASITMLGASKVFSHQSEVFCGDCAVTNPSKPTRFKWNVPYVPDTAPADLEVFAEFINVTSPFIIGTTNIVKFEVILKNNENQAIESQIFIEFPLNLLKMIPKSCHQNNKDITNDALELVCDVQSPFLKGSKHKITISLDMSEVPFDLSNLNISIIAISRSLEKNENNNEYNLSLPLNRICDLEIHGKSVEYTIINTEQELDEEQLEESETTKYKFFKHHYQIMNDGPSAAAYIEVYFQIPSTIFSLGVPVEVINIIEQVAYSGQQPFSCTLVKNITLEKPDNYPTHNETQFPSNRTYILSCSDDSVICNTIKCVVSALFPRTREVKISFALKFSIKNLGAVIGSKDIILIKTYGYLHFSEEKFIEVQSVVWTKPLESKLDFGMIAICIACGFLILLTVVLVLIKCGFFTRQDPMERYFRKKAALALEANSIPPSTFYSPRGSIMVF